MREQFPSFWCLPSHSSSLSCFPFFRVEYIKIWFLLNCRLQVYQRRNHFWEQPSSSLNFLVSFFDSKSRVCLSFVPLTRDRQTTQRKEEKGKQLKSQDFFVSKNESKVNRILSLIKKRQESVGHLIFFTLCVFENTKDISSSQTSLVKSLVVVSLGQRFLYFDKNRAWKREKERKERNWIQQQEREEAGLKEKTEEENWRTRLFSRVQEYPSLQSLFSLRWRGMCFRNLVLHKDWLLVSRVTPEGAGSFKVPLLLRV